MKRLINSASAATKPNKTKLRQQFIKLATDIRDLSKYEFVTLLKEDTPLAMQWIDELQQLYNKFEEEASAHLQYYYMRILVDGKFVGYVSSTKYKSVRNFGGWMKINVTSDIGSADTFANPEEAKRALGDLYDALVETEDGTYYNYNYEEIKRDPSIVGTRKGNTYYVGEISYELEKV